MNEKRSYAKQTQKTTSPVKEIVYLESIWDNLKQLVDNLIWTAVLLYSPLQQQTT